MEFGLLPFIYLYNQIVRKVHSKHFSGRFIDQQPSDVNKDLSHKDQDKDQDL